jgi:secretion/DNA translocation related TadE-like protein
VTTLSTESGVAAVWAASAVSVLMAVLLVGLDLGGAVAGRHRAAAAADLAALAAAGQAVHGPGPACDRARRIAEQMGARLVLCRLVGWDALVEVQVEVGTTLPGIGPAVGRARAGPAPAGAAEAPGASGRAGPLPRPRSPPGPSTVPRPRNSGVERSTSSDERVNGTRRPHLASHMQRHAARGRMLRHSSSERHRSATIPGTRATLRAY